MDVSSKNGMGISVGRLREDTVYDWKFVGLSHNTVRGAAGGAVLCAETLEKKRIYSGKINKNANKKNKIPGVLHARDFFYRKLLFCKDSCASRSVLPNMERTMAHFNIGTVVKVRVRLNFGKKTVYSFCCPVSFYIAGTLKRRERVKFI